MSDEGKWYAVSFRIFSDALNPEQINSILGLASTFKGEKGEFMGGKPGRARYETNVWGFSLDADSSTSFEEQIPKLLDVLEAKSDRLAEILTKPGSRADLFLGFSSENGQGGDYLTNGALRRIANLGLGVVLDLYPPEFTSIGKWRT